MTHTELAAILNGRTEGDEITADEIKIARDNNLLVVYGYSDDNAELRGAIDEEIGAYGGTELDIMYANDIGYFYFNDDEFEEIAKGASGEMEKLLRSLVKDIKRINVVVHSDVRGAMFDVDSDAPYSEFKVIADDSEETGEVYCYGAVIDLSSLKEQQ